ncbi:hypothetical protein GGI00_004489, partial [Coemansia sp. RSA 2681]
MARNSRIKISAMFVVLAAAASANSQGIWDGYALPRAAVEPAVSHVPGSYRAWLDDVRPRQRQASAEPPLILQHHMRVARGMGQDDYTTYDGNEPKYSDTSAEVYTTEDVQPSYETPPPYPVHPTAVYKSNEPYVCPPPIEPTTVTTTVTCTVTEPAPPPVTVTSVCTVTETTTVEVAPYYTQAEYYTTTTPAYAAPAYAAPVYTTPAYAAPAYAAPAYTAPVYTAPVYTAPVYTAPAYAAPAYTAPVYTAPVYTPPAYAAPAYATPAYATPAYATPAYAAPAYTAA